MNRPLAPLARLTLVLLALLGAAPACADDPPPFVPREIIVTLIPGASPAAVASDFDSIVLDSITARNIHRLSVPPMFTEEDFLGIIRNDPRVADAELNFLGDDRNPDGNTQSIFVLRTASDYQQQGAIAVIDADAARAVALGHGVLVAVADSGIDAAHPVFRGRLPMGVIDLITPGGSGADTGDGADSDGDGLIDEFVGHGTIVAGVIARVAPAASILPIRILDSDGQTTIFRLADAIYTAIDRDADIINLSLSTPADTILLIDAISEATAAGILVVCAAGNEATDQTLRFPAGYSGPGLLSVAATRNNDTLAPFSNFGSSISMTAPGDPVVGPIPGGAYGSARGTSFAAPLVAGAAALLRSVTPGLPMTDIQDRLLLTATDIDPLNPNTAGSMGAGRLDAAAAMGLTGIPITGSADLDNSRRVDIDDFYLFDDAPRDITGDAIISDDDADALEHFIRRFE